MKGTLAGRRIWSKNKPAYHASKLLQLGLGYRVISQDYNNKKSGSDRFLYDMDEYGPQVGMGFNF